MDRRDALKKLGMGGATVVGATMVVSSPALAADGTPTCVASSGTLSITAVPVPEQGGPTVTLTITVAANDIVCPCQSPGTAPTIATSGWSLSTGSPSGSTATSASWTGVGNKANFNYSVTVKLTCLDSGSKTVCSSGTFSGSGTVSGGSAPLTQNGTLSPSTC